MVIGFEGVGRQAKVGLGGDEAADDAGVPVALPAGGGQGGGAIRRGFGPELGQASRRDRLAAGGQRRCDRS